MIEKNLNFHESSHPECVRRHETQTECGHGRIEKRRIDVVAAGEDDYHFPHINLIARVVRERESKRTGKRLVETAWLITNHTFDTANPEELLEMNRGHWQIENNLHYVLDDTFREDRSTIRAGAAPRVMAALRALAVSLLRIGGVENIKRAVEHLRRDPVGTLRMVACV